MTASLPADDRRPIATVAIIGNDALLAATPATPVQLAHACLRKGFTVAVPVTWGDELVAAEAVRRLSSRSRGPAVMCVCPFVRSRLLAPGPDLAPFLVSLVPPPVATARYLRTVYGDRGVNITYIGACPGADDQAIDAHLTPDAFLGELAEQGISLAEQPLVFDSIVPPDRRRWCSLPGGVPSAEVLWSETDTRTLVEIERDDVSTDLAQHIIARDHVLLDLAPSLGCSCSGAIPSLTPRSARVAVTALEPPRALGPVIDPTVGITLDAPIDSGRAIETSPPVVVARTQQEIDYDARERALDMILGGEPEPPVVAPPRRPAPPRTETRAPAAPIPRPIDAMMIETVIARAERQLAPVMSSVVLETLIDDILIDPLVIPDGRPAPAEAQSMDVARPVAERAPARSASEVVVELDVVRETTIEAFAVGVRYDNGAAPVLTTSADVVAEPDESDEPLAVEIDDVRVGESPSSIAETVVELPSDNSTPVDVAPIDEATNVEDDIADSTVRRRTPPAMPARHPASTIPKAVSANGRPLPRAYAAKRRVTPSGNAVVPAASPRDAAPAPEQVVADAAPPPAIEVQSIETPAIELPASESPVHATDTIPREASDTSEERTKAEEPTPDVPDTHFDVAPSSKFEPDADAPPPGESVWGVTVEAPIVPPAPPTDPSDSARPIRLSSAPNDVTSEAAPEPRSVSVAVPPANSNTLMTIMVVALVILAVSVFVLLRR